MKKKFILLALFGGLSYVILPGYATGPAGSGYERTGATGAIGCGSTPSCHSNAATGTTTVNSDLVYTGIYLHDNDDRRQYIVIFAPIFWLPGNSGEGIAC
jgi:hypothetical protein